MGKEKEIVANFVPERATKNTVRFQEDVQETPAIGTLYIQKEALARIGYITGQSVWLIIKTEEVAK